MTRRKFQILVVVWQLLTLGIIAADYSTEHTLPAERLGDVTTVESVLDEGRYSMVQTALDAAFWTQVIVGVLAAVGLVFFKPWARAALLVYVIFLLLFTAVAGPYITTGLTAMVIYASSLLDGGILALVYFSSIRKMFYADGESQRIDVAG